MKRMTNFLSGGEGTNQRNKVASGISPGAPNRSSQTPGTSLTSENTSERLGTNPSRPGLPVSANTPARTLSPSPVPQGVYSTEQNLSSRLSENYFDLPMSASHVSLPSAAPRTPLLLSPSPTGQSFIGNGGVSSVGAFGAVQYLAPPIPTTSISAQEVQSRGPEGIAVQAEHSVDRADLHKSLKALETLLVQLDEYRDLQSRFSKIEKKLSRSCLEVAKGHKNVVAPFPSTVFHLASDIFEAGHEVSSKHAKMVQKEYESLNDACAKYFKKIAREERTHEEYIQNLEAKVKKAQSTFDGKKSQTGPRALEAHDKYISTMSSLTSEIAKAKSAHSSSIGQKSHSTVLLLASTVGGLSEAGFRARTETIRRAGPSIGPLANALAFCGSEAMPVVPPIELTDGEIGAAVRQALLEAQAIEAERASKEAVLQQVKEQAVAEWKQHQLQYGADIQQQQSSSVDSATLGNILPRLDSSGELQPASSGKPTTVASSQTSGFPAFSSSDRRPEDSSARSGPDARQEKRGATPVNGSDSVSKPTAESERPPSTSSSIPKPRKSAPLGSILLTKDSSPPSDDDALRSNAGPASDETVEADDSEAQIEKSTGPSVKFADLATQLSDKEQADTNDDSLLRRSTTETTHTPSFSSSSSVSSTPFPPTPGEHELLVPSTTVTVPPVVPEESKGEIKESDGNLGNAGGSNSRQQGHPETIRDTKAVEQSSDRHERRLSLWEREREREKAQEREADLERRLRETEERLKFVERVGGTTAPLAWASSSPSSTPSQSMPRSSDRTEPSQTYKQEAELMYSPRRHLADFAPAIGQSRISSAGVSRTLSTDSERSFVARMKAHYQAERAAAAAVTADHTAEERSRGGTSTVWMDQKRHVSQPSIAAVPIRYQIDEGDFLPKRGAMHAPPVSDRRVAPPYVRTAGQGCHVSEFGVPQPHGSLSPARHHDQHPRHGPAPAHSDICGCQNCSANHYSERTSSGATTSRPRPIEWADVRPKLANGDRSHTLPAPSSHQHSATSINQSRRSGDAGVSFHPATTPTPRLRA